MRQVINKTCTHRGEHSVNGEPVNFSLFEPWGSDPRYKRCTRCGATDVDSRRVSSRARVHFDTHPAAVEAQGLFPDMPPPPAKKRARKAAQHG